MRAIEDISSIGILTRNWRRKSRCRPSPGTTGNQALIKGYEAVIVSEARQSPSALAEVNSNRSARCAGDDEILADFYSITSTSIARDQEILTGSTH
ncbi:MAG: hypothetical protein AB8G18_08690 [Gammaproteobacteria bacterium]